MGKSTNLLIIISLLFLYGLSPAQEGSLKLKSKVELRSWQLTSQAIKKETFLSGASVKLLKENTIVSETTSDAEGNFEINIPPTGEFILLIEYAGHNPKKFAVNSKTVAHDRNDANFKPSADIVGIIMSKPKKDMQYIGLNQPSVTFAHKSGQETKHTPHLRTNIYDGEYKLIQKFCIANKLGDIALEKKNYSLAKIFYHMATDMIEGEEYPKIQLKKAEEGLRIEKLESRKKIKSKQSKVKSAITNQKTSSVPTKNSGGKSSVETGKPARKTLKTLGK